MSIFNCGNKKTVININISSLNEKHTSEKNTCNSKKQKLNTTVIILISLSLIAIILALLLACFSTNAKATEDFISIIKKILQYWVT